jgi:hypothetical protein
MDNARSPSKDAILLVLLFSFITHQGIQKSSAVFLLEIIDAEGFLSIISPMPRNNVGN